MLGSVKIVLKLFANRTEIILLKKFYVAREGV